MKNIEKAALLEYSDLVLDGKEKEEIIYNCYDGKCTYNGKTLNVKGDMPDRGRIIVNEDGATFENIIIKGYNCIKENNKFTCNNTGLTKVNGTSILIDNNKTTEIENYRIYGNSIQNGEPTPDTPVEVESVGDLVTLDNCENYGSDACNNVGKYVIPIKVTGKNLLKVPQNFTWTSDTSIKTYIPASTYTLSWTSSVLGGTASPVIRFYDNNIIRWLGKNGGTKSITLTKPETLIYFYANDYDVITSKDITSTINNLILSIDNLNSYEPYKETITNIYLDEPLRKVGEYSDYIDFKTKKVVRNIKEVKMTGEELFFKADETALKTEYIYSPMKTIDGTTSIYYISTHAPYHNYIYITTYNPRDNLHTALEFRYISDIWKIEYDVDAFKQWLVDQSINLTPVKINYVLESPTEETIELPSILLNKDISVISVGTNIPPSNMELKYYR